ncbi:hypothetical protein [Bacillus sp. MUM 13]|uniref:hypothetical protein n=1 Tax=Bacillus sp. MUM 13 TaxID=1678001 RepID=UPI0008F55868|nr:hypothetical protein [Bacillus sp. MUM 13]OIK08302.1 hypothetical protein BIV59_20405 [Bacillus sp. MUM 13]
MWAITLFLDDTTKIYEFKTEKEAMEYFKRIEGYKILSEIVYSNDILEESDKPCLLPLHQLFLIYLFSELLKLREML